jgi:hypothetical protein
VVRKATSRAVCVAFTQALQRFGIPDEVLTDNGKQFTGRFTRPRPAEVMFERICRENGIVARNTKPRTPTTTGKIERFQCATRRLVISPVQPGGIRREVLGSDGLPEAERCTGTRACQPTSGRVQADGTRCWETRVIWRKLDCLNPNLQKRKVHLHRNRTSETGASPAS